MTDARQVEAFYDAFSERLLRDYLIPNRRVLAQCAFLREAMSGNERRVLVIGCGSGQVTHEIAATMARRADVCGVDISGSNIAIARALFGGRRINYQRLDILEDAVNGVWDAVVLPDVYEHIPAASRDLLHGKLKRMLGERGKILLTLPSPGHQAMLHAMGVGLQVVDETVTLDDLTRMADEVDATMTYFACVSVFRTNDYVHAILERGCEDVRPIGATDRIKIKRQTGRLARWWRLWLGRWGLCWWPVRRMRAAGALRRARAFSVGPGNDADRPAETSA